MKKKLLVLAITILLLAVVAGYMLYNKPHRNISKATSDYVVDAHTLYQDYETDETAANEKYLGKVLKVSGKLKTADTDSEGNTVLALDAGNELFGVTCSVPDAKNRSFSPGQQVTVKGMCTGKLMDVVLIRCVPVE